MNILWKTQKKSRGLAVKLGVCNSEGLNQSDFVEVSPTFHIFHRFGYESIPINTIFRGMNIHLHPFTSYFYVHQRYKVLTHCHFNMFNLRSSRPRPLCKTVNLIDTPSLEQLSNELRILGVWCSMSFAEIGLSKNGVYHDIPWYTMIYLQIPVFVMSCFP